MMVPSNCLSDMWHLYCKMVFTCQWSWLLFCTSSSISDIPRVIWEVIMRVFSCYFMQTSCLCFWSWFRFKGKVSVCRYYMVFHCGHILTLNKTKTFITTLISRSVLSSQSPLSTELPFSFSKSFTTLHCTNKFLIFVKYSGKSPCFSALAF